MAAIDPARRPTLRTASSPVCGSITRPPAMTVSNSGAVMGERYCASRKKGSTAPLSLMTIGFPRRSFAVGTSTRTQPSATSYS
jgi:hypothetical protein